LSFSTYFKNNVAGSLGNITELNSFTSSAYSRTYDGQYNVAPT